MLAERQGIKCVLANINISDSSWQKDSWQKDTPENSSGPSAFCSFPYRFLLEMSWLGFGLSPEPTPPMSPSSPGTFQIPISFTEKASHLWIFKGELELIRLITIKHPLQSGLSPDRLPSLPHAAEAEQCSSWANTGRCAELGELMKGTATPQSHGAQREIGGYSTPVWEVWFRALDNKGVSNHRILIFLRESRKMQNNEVWLHS